MESTIIELIDAAKIVFWVGGGVAAAVFAFMAAVKAFLYVCAPNKVLVFSGRKHIAADGQSVGFRTVFGGRAWRVPIIEDVQMMDLTNISVPMSVSGAYSEGTDGNLGIPLSVHAVANVKVTSDRRYFGNAIERFLGRGREEVARVAKETLEGNLRGVLATMTPEEVNEDRLKFADRLTEEAEADLQILGLHLDTLKIQHVSDERNYLESIGRKRIAEVIQAAEVAESDAQRSAKEAEADAKARSEVALTVAKTAVLQKENELRQITAELDATARSEEERATAAAEQARAFAEKELQEIRGELEQIRLAADVTIPAEIERRVKELLAAGRAASIAEDGRAQAEALAQVSQAWSSTGGEAMNMFVLQNLEEIIKPVVDAASNISVGEVNLIDSGDGNALPSYASSYPATVSALMTQINETLGVNIKNVVSGNGAKTAPQSQNEKGGSSW